MQICAYGYFIIFIPLNFNLAIKVGSIYGKQKLILFLRLIILFKTTFQLCFHRIPHTIFDFF